MSTSAEETALVLQEYSEEARALEAQMVRMAWYMRGAVTIDQAYQMSARQRADAFELIEENIKRTSESGIMMH